MFDLISMENLPSIFEQVFIGLSSIEILAWMLRLCVISYLSYEFFMFIRRYIVRTEVSSSGTKRSKEE